MRLYGFIGQLRRHPQKKLNFHLTDGTEAMIPAKIGCPSLRVVHFTTKRNEQGLMNNLDLLEETRLTATVKNEVHRLKAIQYYNVKVKNRKFKFRDLILKKLKATGNQEVEAGWLLNVMVLSRSLEWSRQTPTICKI